MIPHPILNSRRDGVSAIELRIVQRIDCTKNHLASDAVEDAEGTCHTTPAPGRHPAVCGPSNPSPCRLGETLASMDANNSLRTAPSKTLASMHAIVSPGLFHRKQSETIASTDANNSLRTAPSETRACMHTFVSLRSHPHSRPQNGTSAFMDVPDRFGLGGHGIGPVWMNRYSDEVGSVTLNRFRRNRSRIEASSSLESFAIACEHPSTRLPHRTKRLHDSITADSIHSRQVPPTNRPRMNRQ